MPSKYNPAIAGNTSNIYLTINNDMELDSLGQLVNKVKTFSNGSKLDYIGV